MPNPLFQGLPQPIATPTPTPTTGKPEFATSPYQVDPSTGELVLKSGFTPLLGTIETGLPFTSAKQAGAPAPTTEEAPEGKLTFDQWLEQSGLSQAFYGGGSAIQQDIWNNYTGYLTGEPVAEEGAGGTASIFSPEEERMLTDLTNAISVGQLSEDQAWNQLEQYWNKEYTTTQRAQEAGRRGSEMLAGAFPGPNLPMTGPGGMGEALQNQYGLPNLTPAIEGLPMSQAQGVFGQAQQQMGLPETLSPISPPNIQLPNWQALGGAMPQMGSRNYFEELMREGRSTGV